MEKLSRILWHERELLDTLVFKLESEQLVLASGRNRWLLRAAYEVEHVLETIRLTEILRSVAADEAAGALGLHHNPSLRALAEAAEEPWRSLLLDHHEAFRAVIRAIAALADANRDLITGLVDPANPSSVGRPVFGKVAAGATAYEATGAQVGTPGPRASLSSVERADLPRVIVDLQLHPTAYRASLAASARVVQPSLLDFLR